MRALAVALALVAAAPAGAATLEPAPPALGRVSALRLDVAPADSTEWPTGINAAVRPTADPRVFDFLPLRVGRVGAFLPATGDTLFVEVPTAIEEARPELLRPIQSIGDIRPRWGAALALLAVAAALLGAAVAWFLVRRRKLAPVAETPPEPAEVVALRDLERLERDRLVEAGRFEEFYVRGSHILREYTGRRFGLPVLDLTTSETVDSMRGCEAATGHAGAVAPLLNAADEVKFARHRPESADGEHWLRKARAFVEATTQLPEPAAPDSGEPGAGTPAKEVPA